MENEKKRDSKQAIFNILSQLILNGTNFILIMYFTRHLSTQNYGIVSIYQAYVLFVSVVVGLRTQGSIGPAFVHIDDSEHNDYLASMMLISVTSFIVIFALCVVLINPIVTFTELESFLIYLMLFHCFGNFVFNFLSIKFVYKRKAQYSFILSLAMSVLMVIISVFGVHQTIFNIPDYMGRILGISIPYILCGLYGTFNIFLHGNSFTNIKKYAHFCIPISLPLIIHGLSQVVLGQTDKIMLQKMIKDIGVVGVYSFIVTFVHVLNSIYTALNNTWVPIYYDYTKNGRHKEIRMRASRYADFFTLLIVGFIMVSPEFIKIFADSKYWVGTSLIPVVSLATFMVFMYSFAVNYEIYREKTKVIAIGTSSAAVCNMVLNAILIPKLSMYGAAIATAISYMTLFLFHEYYAKRLPASEYQFSKRFFSKNFIIIIMASIVFHLAIDYWIIRWIIAIFVGAKIMIDTVKEKSIF